MKGVLDYLNMAAGLHPDKTAVACRGESLSFSELNSLAGGIGAALKAVCPAGRAVAVIVRRSVLTEAMFFGCAYNGDYYVPLDPSMPVEKINSILSDCDAAAILGVEGDRDLLSRLSCSCPFVDCSSVLPQAAEAPEVSDAAPLYMVYTSGSTGKPKGVLKSHGAVISFIEAFTHTFNFSEDEIIGNQTPFFFDASAKDIYLSVKLGSTLEIIPSEYFMLPTELIKYLNQRRVTYICWVPTALSMVIQMNAFRKVLPETLNKVFFVGEVFPAKQLNAWISTLPELQYVNLFGSSEIAGICCYYSIDTSSAVEQLPMGKPLENCELWLEDEENSIITEPDRAGELFISSDALALCYYGDKEKTEEKFFIGKTPSGAEKRIFRSGDLAKYDGLGNLVFVSRKDFQIKHLGKRIELGEIEAAADKLEELQRCCCLYDSKYQCIKLFCELREGFTVSGNELRLRLKPLLSDYMLPQKVIILEKMPFNANGKINRTLLAEYR